MNYKEGVSVIIPVFNQSSFLRRAIASLYAQSFQNWELIVINDGSTDGTAAVLSSLKPDDKRVTIITNIRNTGMGGALNQGLIKASFDHIAYLPADDVFFENHLSTLLRALNSRPQAIMAYSGLKFNYQDSSYFSRSSSSYGAVQNRELQLVQVMHRKTDLRWKERSELVTDSLDEMFWNDLEELGDVVPTCKITAEWISHPTQRHKVINEHYGGSIHKYKKYYSVKQNIRFRSMAGFTVDQTKDFVEVDSMTAQSNEKPLKILIVGELAYNAERIAALEKKGHRLYGLWIPDPLYYNTVGPLPFGNIEDIPLDNWQKRIAEIRPDIIYALLNNIAVPLAHEVLLNKGSIPFVWHFKEGPFFCRQQGIWDKLIDLYEKSDGQIYINRQTKEWFTQFVVPEHPNDHLLDGDLPSALYFGSRFSALSSTGSDDLHTVVSGRPFGILPVDIKKLARQRIHLHLYGNQSSTYRDWLAEIDVDVREFVHLHPSCKPSDWTEEFSKYDAGWLHVFQSSNFGELMKMEWPDLNYAARMSTLACAGLPMIQRNNAMHLVATQELTRELGIGLFFSSYEELGEKLRNRRYMQAMRNKCQEQRHNFSFDHHLDNLISFFRSTIEKSIDK